VGFGCFWVFWVFLVSFWVFWLSFLNQIWRDFSFFENSLTGVWKIFEVNFVLELRL
jgi:hypothetical protein